jgi:hypothetical protein
MKHKATQRTLRSFCARTQVRNSFSCPYSKFVPTAEPLSRSLLLCPDGRPESQETVYFMGILIRETIICRPAIVLPFKSSARSTSPLAARSRYTIHPDRPLFLGTYFTGRLTAATSKLENKLYKGSKAARPRSYARVPSAAEVFDPSQSGILSIASRRDSRNGAKRSFGYAMRGSRILTSCRSGWSLANQPRRRSTS